MCEIYPHYRADDARRAAPKLASFGRTADARRRGSMRQTQIISSERLGCSVQSSSPTPDPQLLRRHLEILAIGKSFRAAILLNRARMEPRRFLIFNSRGQLRRHGDGLDKKQTNVLRKHAG